MNTIQKRVTAGKWRTSEGVVMEYSEMETAHLFFSLRMLFNHTCAEEDRIPNCKEWDKESIRKYGATVLREAVVDLLAELSSRLDIQPWMLGQIQYMRDITAGIRILPPQKKNNFNEQTFYQAVSHNSLQYRW